MKVLDLVVKNFRNLPPQTLKFSNGLNIFVGGNAQGKTNLLESIYLCSIGKSPRTDKDKDLVRFGFDVAHARVNFLGRYGEGQISVGIDCSRSTKKHISVNSVPISKLGDLLGYFNCVYFSPDEIKIVDESPSERRKFLDIDLCQTDKNYFFSLGRFNKALAQRNNLLKKCQSVEQLKNTVFVWDSQIAENGARVIFKRRQFCQSLKVFADLSHRRITSNKESLAVEYISQIEGETVDELQKNYLAMLEASLQKDFELRYTTVGCQRDDIKLTVNGKDLRHFGSQGQQRTTALALKLAEVEIFNKLTGEMPVLLLDDVLSELDFERQKHLLSYCDSMQILLTTACEIDEQLLPKSYTKFLIESGVAKKIN